MIENKLTRAINYILIVLILFIFPENKQKNFYLYNAYIMLGIYYVVLLWNMKKLFFTELHRKMLNLPLFIMNAMCILSAIWSQDKKTTLLSALLLLGTTIYGISLSNHFSLKEILNVFTYYFLISAVLSLITAILMPQLGTFYDSTDSKKAWIGIYNSRNTLSLNMSFGVLCSFFNFHKGNKKNLLISSFCLILCTVNLIFSRARTGIIVLIIIFAFIMVWKLEDRLKWIFGAFLGISFTIFLCNLGTIISKVSSLIGRDLSFSGRTSIWEYCLGAVKLKPFLGYGYNSFWIDKWDGQANFIRFQLNFEDLVSAHNGYIGIMLEVGVIGLVIFLLMMLYFFYISFKKLKTSRNLIDAVPVAFMLFVLLYNFSEQMFIKPCSIFWLIQVIAYAKVMKWWR